MSLTFGSLFAGIGGLDLGLERAGLECRWQVEIDPFCQRVLAKHWPDVRRHDDVKTFPVDQVDQWNVDLICGGFPCQDISYAGRGAGIHGERSGLWFEYARIVRVLRPKYVVIENVSALLARGMDAVLGTLADIGYDAEWCTVTAADFGLPQIRQRVFILAHSTSIGLAKGQIQQRAILNGVRSQTESESIRTELETRTQFGLLLRPDAMGSLPDSLAVQRLMGFPDGWTELKD